MGKTLLIWGVFFSAMASASDLNLSQIRLKGNGCDGVTARLEKNGAAEQLIINFKDLIVKASNSIRALSTQCEVGIPFHVRPHHGLRLFNPFIKGRAQLPAHVGARMSVEMAGPGFRGPQYAVGYRSSSLPVKARFSDSGPGTELQFTCEESSEVISTVVANLQPDWRYEGGDAEIAVEEIRLNLQDVPCHQ